MTAVDATRTHAVQTSARRDVADLDLGPPNLPPMWTLATVTGGLALAGIGAPLLFGGGRIKSGFAAAIAGVGAVGAATVGMYRDEHAGPTTVRFEFARDLPRRGADTTGPRPNQSEARQRAIDATVLVDGGDEFGSGWIPAPGYVITNDHVVDEDDDVHVLADAGTRLNADVIARDANNDLALLKVDRLAGVALPMDDVVEEGERGVAVGYPRGTFTVAPVTARSEASDTSNTSRSVVKFIGAADHGSSGGPLVNDAGEVIATLSASQVGVAIFAVPNGPVERLLKANDVRSMPAPAE